MQTLEFLIENADLITLDASRPRATSMAICGDRIAAVGGAELAALAAPSTKRIDLGGKSVAPGFIDAHIHLLSFGAALLKQVNLVGAASIEELLSRLSDQAAKSRASWIVGRGFDQDKLREQRFPTREDLDRVSRDRPIFIARICGHAAVVNSAAIALLSDEQRAAGDPDAGLYTETHADAFYALMPRLSEEEMEASILAAAEVALQSGITTVETLLDTPEQMIGYARLRRKGKLPIRVVGMPPYDCVEQLHRHGINSTFGDERLRFGARKLFSDGSLGARTAWLREPYADDPSTCGIRIYDPDDLKRRCRDAQAKGFQLAIHAIGDQALRETLDAIEFALDGADNREHRHRVEHASICPPDCLERMARLKIVAVVQPQFVTSDTWTAQRVGAARSAWCYPFASMLRAGIPLALSSDCPVEKLDAFACLNGAINRHEWSPNEKLTTEDAMRAYCLGSAYAAHLDDRLGSLEAGKLADFVVLSEDPRKVYGNEVVGIRVERAFIAGKEVSAGTDSR